MSVFNDGLVVVVAWGLAFGALGLLLMTVNGMGTGAENLWWVPDGLIIGLALGYSAWSWNTKVYRPGRGFMDVRGRQRFPIHAALLAVPIVVAVPTLMMLAVVGSVAVGSPAPALVFSGLAFTVLWAGRRAWSLHVLEVGVGLADAGKTKEAMRNLLALEAAFWALPHSRLVARWNLGMIELRKGNLDDAAHWLAIPAKGSVKAFAAASLALVRVLQGSHDAARRLLSTIDGGAAGKVVRSQADAVRVLLILRTEGSAEAYALAERLLGDRAGSLLIGLAAWLRLESGDEPGARDLLEMGGRERIEAEGLRTVVTELDDLLTRIDDE